jgi:hypothetical protein
MRATSVLLAASAAASDPPVNATVAGCSLPGSCYEGVTDTIHWYLDNQPSIGCEGAWRNGVSDGIHGHCPSQPADPNHVAWESPVWQACVDSMMQYAKRCEWSTCKPPAPPPPAPPPPAPTPTCPSGAVKLNQACNGSVDSGNCKLPELGCCCPGLWCAGTSPGWWPCNGDLCCAHPKSKPTTMPALKNRTNSTGQ